MVFKDFFKQLFSYSQPNNHEFKLSHSQINEENINSNSQNTNNKKIYNSLDVNIDYIKTKYNLLINSDIVTRNFILNEKGKEYYSYEDTLLYDGIFNV